jgi:hypothetical protein
VPKHRFQRGHGKIGGRKPGSRNKATIQRERAEEEARIRLAAARMASQEEIEQAAARMHTMNPLEVMLTGMHLKLGRGDIDGAMKIAEAAAPYTAPKLNATEVKVQVTHRSDAEVAAEIEALRAKIERSRMLPTPPMTIETTAESAGPDKVQPVQS